MRVLKLTVAVAALTFSSVVCQAQEQGDQNKKNDRIAQKLNLNPEQTEKLKVLRKDLNIKNKATKEKMTPLRAEIKALQEEKKASKEAFMKEIEGILTPEQFTQFKEMRAGRKEKMKGEKGEH
jgi:Spy/CpxP family protein refolding chaperone